MVKDFIFNMKGVELYQIRGFLSERECDYLSNHIEHHNHPSTISGVGSDINTYSEERSSSSANFDPQDSIVQNIERKIAEEVDAPLSHSEPLTGILYKEGQQFVDHNDFFTGDAYNNHCLASGQRTWTVMIYLNDVEEGGHTEFPELGRSFKPQKGTAVLWKNSDGTGMENPATLHCGMPVIKGKKIIATKWFRENEFRPHEDVRLARALHAQQEIVPQKDGYQVAKKNGELVPIEFIDGIPHAKYLHYEDIPQLTEVGFKKMPIPKGLYHRVLAFYYDGLEAARPEFDPNSGDDVTNFISSEETYFPTEVVWLSDEMKNIIFEKLEPVISEWVNRPIHRTHCYGIRSYKRGAVLKKHIDGWQTRIASAILNIDQKVDEPWALQIDDHQGNEHEIFLEAGEMVLYESAICHHGRVKPFKGDYFNNLFVHYVHLR